MENILFLYRKKSSIFSLFPNFPFSHPSSIFLEFSFVSNFSYIEPKKRKYFFSWKKEKGFLSNQTSLKCKKERIIGNTSSQVKNGKALMLYGQEEAYPPLSSERVTVYFSEVFCMKSFIVGINVYQKKYSEVHMIKHTPYHPMEAAVYPKTSETIKQTNISVGTLTTN